MHDPSVMVEVCLNLPRTFAASEREKEHVWKTTNSIALLDLHVPPWSWQEHEVMFVGAILTSLGRRVRRPRFFFCEQAAKAIRVKLVSKKVAMIHSLRTNDVCGARVGSQKTEVLYRQVTFQLINVVPTFDTRRAPQSTNTGARVCASKCGRPIHTLQGSQPKPPLYTRTAWERVGPRECTCYASFKANSQEPVKATPSRTQQPVAWLLMKETEVDL